jgi:DNA replicative helicase MCM subunit Mcm2 (Cdc46/Mcm family)
VSCLFGADFSSAPPCALPKRCEEVIDRAEELGMDESKADHEIEKLKQKGELYEPQQGYLRTT